VVIPISTFPRPYGGERAFHGDAFGRARRAGSAWRPPVELARTIGAEKRTDEPRRPGHARHQAGARADDTVSLLVGSLGGGEQGDRPPYDVEVLGLFDRCRSLLGAIRLLLAHNFVHEAIMLGRPLFTDSLALAEFAAVDAKRRAELVVGWALGSLTDLEAIFRHARSPEEDASDELAAVRRRRADLHAYARDNGLGTKQWRPDEHAKTLAEKHGRGDEYAALLVTHQFLHGSTNAVSQRYSKATDDTIDVGGPAAQLDVWASDAGNFAAYSTLHAARAACKIFGWAEPSELAELLAACAPEMDSASEDATT
jgi:hypothetical protein